MNAMAAVHRDEFIAQTKGLELLGEVITWDLNVNTQVKYQDLLTALENAGLETKVARELLPRYAFARAAKKMAEQRIIRFVGQTENKLAFQFTKEYKDSTQERFNYDFEATLLLEKTSGAIEVTSTVLTNAQCQELAELAHGLLRKAIENRTTADITRVIKRLFEKNADLFPVREAGSVYFVPNSHAPFVDKVEQFVSGLQGRINRFPVPAGTQKGDKSVQEAVTEGMTAMVKEHFEAVAEFGTDTRVSTVNKALRRVEATKFKLRAYSDYLQEEREKLEQQLALAQIEMQQKLQEILAAKAEAKEQ